MPTNTKPTTMATTQPTGGFEVSPLRRDDAQERTEASAQTQPPEMNVEQLDWQDFSEEQLAVYRPDYIIAADVVRQASLPRTLCVV
jgi:hypothetical protein